MKQTKINTRKMIYQSLTWEELTTLHCEELRNRCRVKSVIKNSEYNKTPYLVKVHRLLYLCGCEDRIKLICSEFERRADIFPSQLLKNLYQ